MLNMDHRAVVMGTVRTNDTGSPDLGRRKRPLSIIEEHLDEDVAVIAPPSVAEEAERGGEGEKVDTPSLGRKKSPLRQQGTPPPTHSAKKTRKKAVVFDHHPFFTLPGQDTRIDSIRASTGSDALSPVGSDAAAVLLPLGGQHQSKPGSADTLEATSHVVSTSGSVRCDCPSYPTRHQTGGGDGGGRGGDAGARFSSAEQSGVLGVSAEDAVVVAGMVSRRGQTACSQYRGQSGPADKPGRCPLCATTPDNECTESPSPLFSSQRGNSVDVCSSCGRKGEDVDEKSCDVYANTNNNDSDNRSCQKHSIHHHHQHYHDPHNDMNSSTSTCAEPCGGQGKPSFDGSSSPSFPIRRVSQNGGLSEPGGKMPSGDLFPSARRVSPQPDRKVFGPAPSPSARRFSPQTVDAKLSPSDSPSSTRRISPQAVRPSDPEGKLSGAADSVLSTRRLSPQPGRRFDLAPWQTATGDSALAERARAASVPGGTERDLTQLKDTATKLKLKTRRPSYLTWRAKYIDKPRDPPEVTVVPGGREGDDGDGRLTQERKARMDNALEWIKAELIDLRRQDQSLAKQLLGIRHELSSLRLAVSCEEHQDLLDDAQEQMEELRELSRFVDFPPDMLDASPLRQIGVTKMNLSSRRFSTC